MTAAATAIRNSKIIADLQAEVAALKKKIAEDAEEVAMRVTILEQVVQKALATKR